MKRYKQPTNKHIPFAMKRINKILALGAILCATGAASLSSCDAVWDSSVSASPYDYYYGWDGEWLPTLSGAPLLSPYYYGGTAFPVSNWRPIYRPGTGPMGGPVAPPVVHVPNRPRGNVRPPQASNPITPSRPSNNSVVPPNPIPTGSNPGIQLPPANSGMQYTPTSQGRH